MFSWSVVIAASLEKTRDLRRRTRQLPRQSKIQDYNRHGEPLTNVGTESTCSRRGFRGAPCSPSPPHVYAQPTAFLPHRLLDRAHALPVLVEHLVWPPSFGHADHRISERRQAPSPHPARRRPARCALFPHTESTE